MASSTKENASPTPRRHRRGTIPDTLNRPVLPSRLGTAEGEASIILGRAPRVPARPFEITLEKALAQPQQGQPQRSPLKIRRPDPADENNAPKSPAIVLPSSPLPMPSPGLDPWMDINNSSIAQMDKMALPISTGQPYSRPEWNPPPKQHRVSKSVSQVKSVETTKLNEKATVPEKSDRKAEPTRRRERTTEKAAHVSELEATSVSSKRVDRQKLEEPKTDASHSARTDAKFDLSKITAHHAEGSAQVKHDRSQMLPVDRKEQARRRLEERKKLRKAGPSIVAS